MTVNILAFGITKDIVGNFNIKLELPQGSSVQQLKQQLSQTYPAMNKLTSLLIAVNESYEEDGYILQERDEIALIPPVSGG